MASPSINQPPAHRGDLMPNRQRGPRRVQQFQPNYVSFAGTYQCNLSCPHCCVPIEWTDRLSIPTAIHFLEQCHMAGIRILGFTGGEPFLYPEFLIAVTRRAAQLGFRFDKLMSNGVWPQSPQQARDILRELHDAGFQGKLGLSVDKFRGIRIESLVNYCHAARDVFQQDNILALNYASRHPSLGLEPIQKLAKALDGVVEWSDWLKRYLLVSDDFTMTLNWNHLAEVERAEHLGGGHTWDGTWFTEDFCEGPGQALIVNPRGEVKPCCGFASDLDQLTIGNIHEHSVETIIQRGREHPVVGRIFREGLSSLKDAILKEDPEALPGATSNHCYFCWYILSKGVWDQTRSDPADRVGSGGQWEKLRIGLPLATGTLGDDQPKSDGPNIGPPQSLARGGCSKTGSCRTSQEA